MGKARAALEDGVFQTPVKPRVMMAVPQYPFPVVGGLERQAHELAKALLELGIEVQALSGKVEPSQPSRETVEGVLVHRIPWSRRKWLRFIRTPFDLLRVLCAQRNNYDVIHLHQYSWFGLFMILTARVIGKPILTKLPNVAGNGIPGMLASRFGALKLTILKLSDALVAMSEESLRELEAVGFQKGRTLATPNGIRLFKGKSNTPKKTRPGGKVCRVVFVGRLTEQKAIDDLLFAWAEVVRGGGHSAELELWGTGQLKPKLTQLCCDLGVLDTVIFKGHVDPVRDSLGEMDIFVLPSRVEGNSNALLEAMEAGLPIVSTRVGGTPMLVGKTGEAFLIDVGDRPALAKCLSELTRNTSLRERLGEAMRQRVVEYFDINSVARTYASAYQRLAVGARDRVGELSNPIITSI
jgi:glycosyltransferase involved in cell wall biosynthesis